MIVDVLFFDRAAPGESCRSPGEYIDYYKRYNLTSEW